MYKLNFKTIIYAADSEYLNEASILARYLNVSVTQNEEDTKPYNTFLRFDRDGITLISDGMEVRGDFSAMNRRYSQSNLRSEILIKAAGIYRKKSGSDNQEYPLAVDATAGLGEDAFLLAAAGYRVIMFERDPIIAAMLQDSVKRGRADNQICEILERMNIYEADSIQALKKLKEKPEIILLDPMFPQRQKSGLVKKKFQLLHILQRPCNDEEDLMNAAKAAAPGKIIVKRPLKGPLLAGMEPSYSLKGRSIRYDVYMTVSHTA